MSMLCVAILKEFSREFHRISKGIPMMRCAAPYVNHLETLLESKFECKGSLITDNANVNTMSSVYGDNVAKYGAGKLDSATAWAAKHSQIGEWFQMDLGTVAHVAGVVTQGRQDSWQWVTSYTVQASNDLKTWIAVDGGKTFTANTGQGAAKVENKFAEEFTARCVAMLLQFL